MPPHPLPTAVHEAKGSYIAHPERRKKAEPKPRRGLGAPPKRLTPEQREAWDEIVDQAIPGVLFHSDRGLVELTARLTAEVWAMTELKPAVVARLESCLGRLGMTPADRTRIVCLEEKTEASPWDQLGGAA